MKRHGSTDEEWYGATGEKMPKVEMKLGEESCLTNGGELVDKLAVIDDQPPNNEAKFLPPCWNMKQYENFRKKYEGLIVQHKKLGCSICAKAYYGYTQGTVHVSPEWGSCNVNAAGANKKVQQASLRKKMHDHFTSKKHTACAKQEVQILAKITCGVDADISPTCRVFNTVYGLAKNKRSLHDIEDLIELQEKNALDMGDAGLHSRQAAVKIADHISYHIRRKVFNRVIERELKFCIVIDEITTLLKPTFLVFLKIENLAHLNIFFDLLEFENQQPSASTIYLAVLESLINAGINEKYLERHLVGVYIDGSNKVVGHGSQVGGQFEKNFADIVVWYGLNHGLQLSVDSFNNDIKHVINLITFDEISLLGATTLSHLMTITFTGLPLQLWDPQPSVKTWIEKHGFTTQGTSKDVKKNIKNYTFNQLAIWNLLE